MLQQPVIISTPMTGVNYLEFYHAVAIAATTLATSEFPGHGLVHEVLDATDMASPGD